jgi:hypothetical protein
MCQPHESHSEACSREFSTSRRYSSVTWNESTSDAEGTYDSSDNGIAGQQALIDADICAFRERLRHVVRRLTVAEFAELRRQYEDVWLEVLEEL